MNNPADVQLQFMMAEVDTCSIALDSARLELSLGQVDAVRHRLGIAAQGIETLERFLPLIPADDRPNLTTQISALRNRLDALHAQLPVTP